VFHLDDEFILHRKNLRSNANFGYPWSPMLQFLYFGGGDPVPNFQNRMLRVLPHLHSKYRTHIGYKLTKFLFFLLFCIYDFAHKLSPPAQTRRQYVPFSSSSPQLCWTFLIAHSMARLETNDNSASLFHAILNRKCVRQRFTYMYFRAHSV